MNSKQQTAHIGPAVVAGNIYTVSENLQRL